jgi:DNA adenine methylase
MATRVSDIEKNSGKVLPFLRWAGAKRWLTPTLAPLLSLAPGKYIEPFLGSGSMFFATQPKNSILSDANPDLISAFKGIRANSAKVWELLNEHSALHGTEHFYETRTQRFADVVLEAARFIYINRACFNGIYRVNKNNIFNVPLGRNCKVILPSDNFAAVSERLQNAEILNEDFSKIIGRAKFGDVVFADPPYTVNHNNNGFIEYNEKIFSWDDQIRLRDDLTEAGKRGAIVYATNAAHESIFEIYHKDFYIISVERNSKISGTMSGRGRYEEYLISNMPIDLTKFSSLNAKLVTSPSVRAVPEHPLELAA